MSGLTTVAGLILALGQTVAGDQPASPPVDLAAVVEQLGSGKYEARQQATERLWSAGNAAIPVLERATLHKNPEIRSRASYVLENLRQGITLDTPREILREVQRFREGDVDDKRFALRNLENALRPRIVLGLIQNEQDPRLRDEWFRTLERATRFAILAGSEREVELALRDAATDDDWMRHWSAYLADCGRIDDELARLAAIPAEQVGNPAAQARLTAYLLRAKGELSEARRYAEQAERLTAAELPPPAAGERAERSGLAWELTLEMRDWPTAARLLASRLDRDEEARATDAESLGFAAAYHRLAGDLAGSQRYADLLRQLADESDQAMPELDPRRQDVRQSLIDRQWVAGKALLLNGEHGNAMHVLRRNHASFAFEVLAHQQRYREAFALAGVAYPHGFNSDWFHRILTETASADDSARQRFNIAMHALRHLYFLGQRDQVREWLTAIHQGTAKDSGTVRRRMVCDTAVKLGLRELAIDAAAVVLEREGSPAVLSVLYPNRGSLATMWFEFFREQRTREPLVETLPRIDRCLRFAGDKLDHPEWLILVADVQARLDRLAEPKRAEWWHGLAETSLLHGETELAWRQFEKAAALSAADALRMGDLHAAEQHWLDAADWYRRAWEFDKLKPLPAYLQARALIHAGRGEEGERLAAIALRLALGSDDLRRDLAAGLKERGYRQESLRQFELLLRTGKPGEQDVIEAGKQIGNAVHSHDALRAADCWEAMALCCLRSKWGFVDANGYVQIPFLVHKTRARGLVRAGQWPLALAEIQAARNASPLNVELPEELIPVLQEAQRQAEADELFYHSYRSIEQQCQDFPDCATLHNNLAWLVARNGRELDEALRHAERALVLDPGSASYLDTLGEVHFRRGQFAEAVRCAERCVEIDSRNTHYQEQLARFRQALGGG